MNLQFLAENTFVISLKEREDRRKNVTKEMRNQKIAFQFFDGIKDANPIYGCTASHVGVIKIAKEKKLPYVLIFEDDAKFVQPFRMPALPDNWDMLYLGSCVNKIYDEYYYNWKKVCCWYGHSYIVRECMYDRIIQEASRNWDKVLIDEYYCEFLHPHIQAYTIYPTMVTQSEDYSDILHTTLDRHQKIINFDRLVEMKTPNPAQFRDIYCINTQEREDKFEYMTGLFMAQNLKAQFYRPKRNMESGAKGCRESHLAVLRDARKRGLPSVLIFEDDVDFVGDIREVILPKQWDMFYIGGNWVDILDNSESDNYCKVRSWSTYAYAVNKHFYDVLIEGLEKTEKEIDRYYLENIHPNHRVYMSKPQIVVPSEKFEDSDIMSKKMDYAFLREMEKINLGEKNVSKPAKVKVDKLEWIIVDDSVESIASLLPNDSRLKYYHFGEDEKKALLSQIGSGSGGGEKLPIGMKRNIGANLAVEGAVIVHMDDDDYYPPNSVRIRVMALLSSGKECVSCSAIANFNIKRMISMINVPPYDMSYEKRVSEACLGYTKGFWERQKYNNRAICSEAEDFIRGRTDEVVDTDWQGIIISLRHSGNMTNRNEMTEEPNGWHFGKIEDKLFLFLTSFDP